MYIEKIKIFTDMNKKILEQIYNRIKKKVSGIWAHT